MDRGRLTHTTSWRRHELVIPANAANYWRQPAQFINSLKVRRLAFSDVRLSHLIRAAHAIWGPQNLWSRRAVLDHLRYRASPSRVNRPGQASFGWVMSVSASPSNHSSQAPRPQSSLARVDTLSPNSATGSSLLAAGGLILLSRFSGRVVDDRPVARSRIPLVAEAAKATKFPPRLAGVISRFTPRPRVARERASSTISQLPHVPPPDMAHVFAPLVVQTNIPHEMVRGHNRTWRMPPSRGHQARVFSSETRRRTPMRAVADDTEGTTGFIYMETAGLEQWLTEYLTRQVVQPRRGMVAPDPRVSAFWDSSLLN